MRYRIATEGGETLVNERKRYGDPFTKGDKMFLCKICNQVWQWELPKGHKKREFTYLPKDFPKLQTEKDCPKCLKGE